jgi:uncharacterized protein (DUF433 family)
LTSFRSERARSASDRHLHDLDLLLGQTVEFVDGPDDQRVRPLDPLVRLSGPLNRVAVVGEAVPDGLYRRERERFEEACDPPVAPTRRSGYEKSLPTCMAQRAARIVRTEDVRHGEPRIEGRRSEVRQIRVLVEESGLSAAEVAERFDLRVADVYAALTYYHGHPGEMRAVERRRQEATERIRKSRSVHPEEFEEPT